MFLSPCRKRRLSIQIPMLAEHTSITIRQVIEKVSQVIPALAACWMFPIDKLALLVGMTGMEQDGIGGLTKIL
jgi:hypothetical protein